MNINLSKFKKIDSDDHCTTLIHPDGHEFKVAHSKLDSKLRKDLEEMPMHLAKGGKAKFAQKYDPTFKKQQASKAAASTNTMPGSPTKAKQAYTEPDDQGTDVVVAALNKEAPPFGPLGSPKYHSPPCINPSCKSYGKPHPNCRCYGGKMGMYGGYAEGGEVDNYCSSDRPHEEGCEYFKDGGDVPMEQADPETAVPMGTPAPEPAPSPSPSPAPMVSEQMAPEQADTAPEAVKPEPVAQQPEKPVEQPAEQPVEQPKKTPLEAFQEHKDASAQELFPEAQAFQADLDNGHIQPKTYSDLFAKKDTLGKIGTLFGLLVGGAGSGLSGQPNALLEMMNKEIERDLDAQKQSVVNKQNYLKINQNNIYNRAQAGLTKVEADTKAYALARVQMNYAALHNLAVNAMKLPPGPQRDQAMNTLAMLNQSVQNENYNIIDRATTASALGKTMFGGNGENTAIMKSGLMGPEAKEMGTDIEHKTIPGIPGRAARPIDKSDRDQVVAMKVLGDKVRDVLDFAKKHKGSINPNIIREGAQKSEELVNFYNQSLGGALTGYKLPWLQQQIGKNPTSLFQDILGSNARLKEIERSNAQRMGTLLQSYGFKTEAPKAEQKSNEPVKSKSGKEIIQKNGKWVYK